MKYFVTDNYEKLLELNIGIAVGFKNRFRTESKIYSEILTDGNGRYALPIDETDQRNPLQYLYEEEKSILLNELPIGEWVNV